MGQLASQIEEKLGAAFAPDHLEVVDESYLHAGHAGARPEGETHFRVVIVAAGFEGVSRLERQRNQILQISISQVADPDTPD